MKIKKIISVCIERDIAIWKISHKHILENIEADEYEVIVPEKSVALFRLNTDERYQVVSENIYVEVSKAQDLKRVIDSKISNRFGWYLQQFLKIESARRAQIGNGGNEVYLIWDADTVPLRKLDFVNYDNSLNYYFSTEYHQPYFKTLGKILNSNKLITLSFIAQCFPLYGEWAVEFCESIEDVSKTDWMTTVALSISGESNSEFSEYESLGNWASAKYLEKMKLFDRSKKWTRFGTSLFGKDIGENESVLLNRFSKYYDFVSFENWDTDFFQAVNIGCGDQKISKSTNGARVLNLDLEEFPSVDLVLDVNDKNWYLPSGRFHHVLINNVLEHIDDVVDVFKEIDRIMAKGGILEFEVPYIGSFNHGTDVTHKRGFTFNSFDFLHESTNYLYRYPERNPFKFKLVKFWRENVIDKVFLHEEYAKIPHRGEIGDWAAKVSRQEIPGTFGLVLQKK